MPITFMTSRYTLTSTDLYPSFLTNETNRQLNHPLRLETGRLSSLTLLKWMTLPSAATSPCSIL